MRRIAITMFLVSFIGVSTAETRQELVIDCDKHRDDPVTCTACNIYHEARDQAVAGQLAVALVTRNRVEANTYPNAMCEVVWEARRSRKTGKMVPMFSWTLDGKHDRVYNKRRWTDALKLAAIIVSDTANVVHDFTLGALWYHRYDISPFWKFHYHEVVRIGDHVFYVEKEEQFLNTLATMSLTDKQLQELTIDE